MSTPEKVAQIVRALEALNEQHTALQAEVAQLRAPPAEIAQLRAQGAESGAARATPLMDKTARAERFTGDDCLNWAEDFADIDDDGASPMERIMWVAGDWNLLGEGETPFSALAASCGPSERRRGDCCHLRACARAQIRAARHDALWRVGWHSLASRRHSSWAFARVRGTARA